MMVSMIDVIVYEEFRGVWTRLEFSEFQKEFRHWNEMIEENGEPFELGLVERKSTRKRQREINI